MVEIQGRMKLRCFFCGKTLVQEKSPAEFSCPGCRAFFRGEMDETGCITRMQVQGCGTPDCCRTSKKKRRPSL